MVIALRRFGGYCKWLRLAVAEAQLERLTVILGFALQVPDDARVAGRSDLFRFQANRTIQADGAAIEVTVVNDVSGHLGKFLRLAQAFGIRH